MAESKMICPRCGTEMNRHAEKIDYTAALDEEDAVDEETGGILEEIHTCPDCGDTETRRAGRNQ
jgi:ssDNA-binding Zn-finger/Zn-ribbon topoisomerase 1